MEKIISFFLAILEFFGVTFNRTVIPHEKPEDFVPVVRFMACSDTHIGSADDFKLDRIKKAIAFCYETAENDETYNKLDAVMFAGDLTDSGTDEQFEAFESTVKGAVRDGTEILAIVAKEHDSTTNGKKSTEWCKKITGKDSDFHTVINGFHFIGISTSKNEGQNHSLAQRTWLKKELKAATADDKNRPVFVFNHEHVSGTVYGSRANEGWGITDFKSTLGKFPQAVHLSGHSHYPLNDPRSVWQGNFTAIGTSSMNYMEFTVDNDKTVHPEGCGNAAQAWLIEVDSSYRIRLRGFDVLTSEWLCDYLIRDLSDKETYDFTPYNQEKLSSAPEFDKDAGITAVPAEGKYRITFPAADSTDGNPVFLYRISVLDKNGMTAHSEYFISNYWSSQPDETITVTVEAEPGNTVNVLAENAYGMQSPAISTTIGK